MSRVTLPRVDRSERRPRGAMVCSAWMLVTWAGLLALVVHGIDAVWSGHWG